jgi:uncharacterized membrane protein
VVWLSVHHYINQYLGVIPVVIGCYVFYPWFIFVCAGFLELVTGSPFSQLGRKWMALRGWQRGVLGTLIVLATAVFIILIAVFFQKLSTK